MKDETTENTFVNEDGSAVNQTNWDMDKTQNPFLADQVKMWEGNGGTVEVTTGTWTTATAYDTCDCQVCMKARTVLMSQWTKDTSSGTV